MEIFAQGIRIVYMKQKHELVTTIRCEASELVRFFIGGERGGGMLKSNTRIC